MPLPPRTYSAPGPRKTSKSFNWVGESFLDGIRVAHKRLQEHSPAPPPVLRYLKPRKSAILTHFSDDFELLETNFCKLQHLCVLTSFAGTMQKRRKRCKYRYFLGEALQIPVFLKAKQKNTVNYNIFSMLIAKNASIYKVFAMSRKSGRNETL